MKKSRIQEILACLVVLLAMVLFARWWKQGSDRSGCIINIRNVQQSARGYIGMNAREFTAEEMWHDIFYSEDAFLKLPQCPSGGTYTFHKPEHMYQPPGFLYCTCSHADTLNHKPEGTEDW